MVSGSVSKKFGIEKSIGFGIEIIWYRKKYRIRYRKNLVSEKVSDSVSFRFWVSPHTGLCIRIAHARDFVVHHLVDVKHQRNVIEMSMEYNVSEKMDSEELFL